MNANTLLQQVHERIGLGLTIDTSPTDHSVTIRWRRDYGRCGDSDQRTISAASLIAGLQEVLSYEDDADLSDYAEAARAHLELPR